jgi:hypothetical protein
MNKKGKPVVKDYGFLEDKYVKSWLAGLAAKSQSRSGGTTVLFCVCQEILTKKNARLVKKP